MKSQERKQTQLTPFEQEAAFNVAMENFANQEECEPYFFALNDIAPIMDVIREAQELNIPSVSSLLQALDANFMAEKRNARLIIDEKAHNALMVIATYCDLNLEELRDQLLWQKRRRQRDQMLQSFQPEYLNENLAAQLNSAITALLEIPELKTIAMQKGITTFSGLLEEMEGVYLRFPTANEALRRDLDPEERISYELARYRRPGVESALILLSRMRDHTLPTFWDEC